MMGGTDVLSEAEAAMEDADALAACAVDVDGWAEGFTDEEEAVVPVAAEEGVSSAGVDGIVGSGRRGEKKWE